VPHHTRVIFDALRPQIALANLAPVATVDEMDSYMYQTVGHEAVEWIAQVRRAFGCTHWP
jgi:diphthamide synthase (EF-2-diphthine--ammonia ligase)